MNYDESAKIIELEKDLKNIKQTLIKMQESIIQIQQKQLHLSDCLQQILTDSKLINQNSLQSTQITAGENNEATQRGFSTGTEFSHSPIQQFTEFRKMQMDSQQNSPRNRQDDERTPIDLAMLLKAIGDTDELATGVRSYQQGNSAQSRSDKESRRSGAETERSERISAISLYKTRLNEQELSTLNSYDEKKQEQIIEKINNTISKIDKDIQYYEEKKSILTIEAKERIPKQIINDIAILQTKLNKYSTNSNIMKNTTNSKAFENIIKFYQTQKIKQAFKVL